MRTVSILFRQSRRARALKSPARLRLISELQTLLAREKCSARVNGVDTVNDVSMAADTCPVGGSPHEAVLRGRRNRSAIGFCSSVDFEGIAVSAEILLTRVQESGSTPKWNLRRKRSVIVIFVEGLQLQLNHYVEAIAKVPGSNLYPSSLIPVMNLKD